MTDDLSTLKMHGESRKDDISHASGKNNSKPERLLSKPYSDSAIAVTGMACKFAGADSLEQFWKILETGTSMCRDLPKDRFPDARFERRAYSRTFKGNMIDDVDAFDHKFFKFASREATFMDPQQRLALQVTYQALESAGYFDRDNSEAESEDMGCYFGACTNEYHDNVATHSPSAFSLTGSIRPFIAGKVSHHFGWTGPAIMLDTACAASGTAINQACRAVATGECSTAVAGGVNIFVSPDTFQNLAAGHFMNTTGQSKSFDAAADGYCRGEGVAVVVLKKLSAALQDGDPIQGVISATAVNQNANETSITIPHGPSQMNLYRKALQRAGVDAREVSYVEAHGTGTPVGDPIEAESIRGVFGNSSCQNHDRKTYFGSLKSNIGHTEATSGLSGLIKVLLMMQKGVIPQQALFKNLNPAIAPLEPSGIEIPKSNVPWTSGFKAACVNNYGASGTNAVMVVTQPPQVKPLLEKEAVTTYPVSITAFSRSSLASYCLALLEFINQSGNTDLATICYHLSRRKNLNLPYSVSGTVSSFQELEKLLTPAATSNFGAEENKHRPVVLFFGGQTGKTACVARDFYASFAIFRKYLDDCNDALEAIGAPSIFPAIFDPHQHDDVVISHSILFSIQYASAMAWLDCGLKPSRVVGHSFGQYTALCISGVLSLADSLQLVTGRARLINEHWGKDPGSMIAIEAEPQKVSKILAQHSCLGLEIACRNGSQSFVLAGSTSSTEALEGFLKSSNEAVQWKRLQVTHAFHSALAEPLLQPLQDIANRLTFHTAKITLETCSKDSTWQSLTPALIVSHTREPVYFHQAVERISDQIGPCTWLEAGSGFAAPMLRRALGPRESVHTIKSLALDSASSERYLAEVTAELWKLGVNTQFWHFHRSQNHQYRVMNLPPYQFDKSRHWLDWKELGTPKFEVQHPVPEQTSLVHFVRRSKDQSEFEIDTRCEKWQTTCSEHRFLGVSVCPMSLLLDIISKAIDIVQDGSTQTAGLYAIQHLATQSPIPAKSEKALSLTIRTASNPQSWSFVLSMTPNSSQVYASGTVSAGKGSSGGDFARFQRLVDITQIKTLTNDAEADSVKGKAVYKSMADLFELPKSRQGIREVSAKGNEAAGYLMPSLFNSSFAAIENYIQIPLIYLNSLQDRQENDIYINTGMGHAEFEGSLDLSADKIFSWAVYLKFFQSEGSETTCDIFVFDSESEKLSVVILDVTFNGIQKESLREALGRAFIASPQQTTSPSSGVSEAAKAPEISKYAEPCNLQTQLPESNPPVHGTQSTHSTDLPDLTKALYDLLIRVADLNLSELRSDVLMEDLGIDSLMGMEVAEEINNIFSTNIGIAEFANATDLGSLCKVIADKTTSFSYGPEDSSRAQSDVLDSDGYSAGALTAATSDSELSSDVEDSKITNGSLTSVLKAFDTIRNEFDVFAKETGCDKFWSEVYPIQASLIVAYINEAFAKLGCDLSAIKAGEKIPRITHLSKRYKLMIQLMRALQDDGLVTQAGNDWIRTSKPVSVQPSSSQRFDQIEADFPQFTPEHKLLHAVGSKLDECLSGKLDAITLLFGNQEKRKLMADQYLMAPIQCSVSKQLASFIKKCFVSRPRHQTIRVLEIGGGTCGTTLHAVNAFAQLGIDVEYTFTDISSSFVSAAKSKLGAHRFVKFRTLDITEDPGPDIKDHFDMIIATNVIHATPDACKSARNSRKLLRPGGFLTLVEYTQSIYLLDVIFGQLDGWWAFDDGREHAIMDVNKWKAVLERAGFEKIDWTGGRSRESEIMRIILAC